MNSPRRHPYPGLRAFTREESDLFFGRESCVDDMVDHLAATRFLAVLGPSGSGKSSLVRTGLLDALDLGLLRASGSHWVVADMHPGGQPMRQLATALLRVKKPSSSDPTDINLLTTFLRRGPRSVAEWVSGGNLEPRTNLLLLVDQFEELFRYADYAQREEAEAFVATLLESASTNAWPIFVAITMRSEYLGACASVPDLAERISAGLYLTPRMDREQCKEAIEGPAAVIGFSVEPALVNRMLNDMASFAPWEAGEETDLASQLARQADQLPLMQHVLNRLWMRASDEQQQEITLRVADYDRLGGLSGALNAHGAEVVSALGPERLSCIESVFRSLTTGISVVNAVRRPSTIRELTEVYGGSRGDVVAVVNAFRAQGCDFLRTSEVSLDSDNVIVDISHESLIRQWAPLRGWLEAEIRDNTIWRRLIYNEERYTNREGDLLHGLDYQSSIAWWNKTKPSTAWALRHGGKHEAVHAYLDASEKAEEARLSEEQARLRRGRNQLIAGVVGLAGVLAVVSFLSLISWREARKAKAETSRAQLAETSANDAKRASDQAYANAKELNDQLRLANDLSNRTSLERDKALNTAESEKKKAEQEAEQLSTALAQVSGVINSDAYGRLAGVSNLKRDLMAPIQHYQGLIEKNHKNIVGQDRMARDSYGTAMAFDAVGDAVREREQLKEGYERGLKVIASLPPGRTPSEDFEADFSNDVYRYVWFLLDIGETAEGEQVLSRMQDALKGFPMQAKTAALLTAQAKMEALASRIDFDENKKQSSEEHERKALALVLLARKNESETLDTETFYIQVLENMTLYDLGAEKVRYHEQACTLAAQHYKDHPNDLRFIRDRVDCLSDEGDKLANGENPEPNSNLGQLLAGGNANSGNRKLAAATVYLNAESIAKTGLQKEPSNQTLLLEMADLENSLGYLYNGKGEERQLYHHRMNAKAYFVSAIQGRTIFAGNESRLKNIYNSTKNVTFDKDDEKYDFFKEIIDALSTTLDAFPKAPSLAYVAADAASNISATLVTNPDRAQEAIKYLSESIEWYGKSGLTHNINLYSEDFAEYCWAYQQRSSVYGSIGNLDMMRTDANTMEQLCAPILSKYPWDFYLRQHFIQSANNLGQVYYKAGRYREALPKLEYASHWVYGDSTRTLAKMYRDGVGVDKDEKKAQELDALAKTQFISYYTVPIDYNGVKFPTDLPVRDWPSDYPYQGIDDLVMWYKQARSGTISSETADAFRRVYKYAQDNHTSFRALVDYVVNENAKNKEKKEADAKPSDPDLESARTFMKAAKWDQAAQAAEKALARNPDSLEALGLAQVLYHEYLFRFDRAYTLNLRRVQLGEGDEDFVESNLTVSKFETCASLAAVSQNSSKEPRWKIVMSSLEFACLTAERKPDFSAPVGMRLRKQLHGLEKVGWTFSGTEHFMESNQAFKKNASTWVSLFTALESGDQAKANQALTALGVPQ